jgi:predicted phage tail protein
MSETWIEIQPGGYLKKFGNHKFFVNTPAEAIKAMLMQNKDFDKAFRAAGKRGVQFAIRTEKRDITNTDQLHMGKPKVVKLIPKYSGGKNSGMTFLAVAAIIAATVLTAGAAGFGAGAWFAAGSTSAMVATSVAISLALGGITQLLAPQPEGLKTTSDPENKASYAFGGPVNTTAQGQPVPVFYGYREVGGAVVSATIVSEDQQ